MRPGTRDETWGTRDPAKEKGIENAKNIKKEWVFRSVRRFLALPDCVQKWPDAGPAGLNQPETRTPAVQSRAGSSHTSCRACGHK